MKNYLCGKRVWLLAVAATLLAAKPCFSLVTSAEGASALAKVEYMHDKAPDKTPEQRRVERDQLLEERNQKVLAEMSRPPVGFAPYDNAGIAPAGGEDAAAAGDKASSGMSLMQKNLLGLLFLGLVFFVAGLVLRKKQPPPDEPDKSFPRKFSA